MNKKINKVKKLLTNYFIQFRNPKGDLVFDKINLSSNTSIDDLK